ncbi:bifunctional phosphatase IMPL2, chloroplastic-like isoform X3 [Prosopis cineraria]|uniref:bifunctional phosphatase IMPL2, chloroplastic-like isoform X3 n=1 Tax=Prosopis cineraria TaxID=364024 RepID=UPI00240F3038|nr:bifunctional phosphatase IMPL2, chloroplastic-like isoform X3 [Prosopis cineraria]
MFSQSRLLSLNPTFSSTSSLSSDYSSFPSVRLKFPSTRVMASGSKLTNGGHSLPIGITEPQIKRFTDVGNKVADAAGQVIRKYFRKKFDIFDKDDSSPVTIADRSAEEAMVSIILEHFPSHAIYGEEKGWCKESSADYVWVLDPIDGTKSFITGKPLFGTLIALLLNGKPILGIIDQPVLRERWIGISGKKTMLNGQEISSRTCANLSHAYLYTTSPHLFGGDAEKAFIRVRNKPYDFLALIPVIEGAGGVITDWKGGELHWEASPTSSARKSHVPGFNVLAAGDKRIHQEALDSLQWR